MRRNTFSRGLAALAAAALLGACVDEPLPPTAAVPAGKPAAALSGGGLQWFGYVSGASDEASLIGTSSYANWGMAITDGDPASTLVTQRVNAMSAHGMKAVVELGQLLWCGDYTRLCPDYAARWATWKAANPSVLNGDRILAFIVRDEPFNNRVDIAQYEAAAAMVKGDFPWASMIMVEWAGASSCLGLPEGERCYFADNAWRMRTVDWVGVHMYRIHPATDVVYQYGLQNLKQAFPGKKVVYVADGYWDRGAFEGVRLEDMDDVMAEWHDVAASDRDAVLLGVFIWDSLGTSTTSRDFPPAVLAKHTQVGRFITKRTRSRLYAPTGYFRTIGADGHASGWACDPDGAWGETVVVDFHSNGVLVGSGRADQRSGPIAQCRSGVFRSFRIPVAGPLGQRVTATARDLDGGSTELAAGPAVQTDSVRPPGRLWNGTMNVFGWARNGTGGVQLSWRDATTGGAWAAVAAQPVPATLDGSWKSAFPASNPCHRYEVQARYGGATSAVRSYSAAGAGFCQEDARVIWIQPAELAGYGPPESLVVAGSATGGPAGQRVQMWYRDVTAGAAYTLHPYEAPTDANGTWLNSIPNFNPYHQYAVYARYDVVKTSTCVYSAQGDITWC